jgi:SAM-dependent methyltransferase
MVSDVVTLLVRLLVASPWYPHWLSSRKMLQGNAQILQSLHGDVLEVGAGDGSRKQQLVSEFPQIQNYTVTDYSSWDGEFETVNKKVSLLGRASEVFFGYTQRGKLDLVCDAMNLPFSDKSYDAHLSFEVLEHISDPYKFFSEAQRVLRSKGRVILSVPVLFRVHGGEPNHRFDFFRYMPGFFAEVAERNGFVVKRLYANTGVGTSVAQMVNQWIILKVRESSFPFQLVWLLVAGGVFPVMNVLGWIIDLKPDTRFATRFHVVLQKK